MQGEALAQESTNAYDENKVEDALIAMTPYVIINEDKSAKMLLKEAKANGVSKEDIKIAKDYVKMINKLAKQLKDNPQKQSKIDNEDKVKFNKFFDKIKNKGGKNKAIENDTTLSYILPSAYAACNVWGPHNQPGTTYDTGYTSRSAALASLPSGFNQVPDWASHNFPDDYADWIVSYGCADGVFRIQSIVGTNDSVNWFLSEHHGLGEPNPEVLSYLWPSWWWGPYATLWHGL